MARLKEWLMTEAEWLSLLARLFEATGFTNVSHSKDLALGREPDLMMNWGSEVVVAELKLYRSDRVPLALVRNAFSQLDILLKANMAQRAILIVPQRLASSHYVMVQPAHHELWGLDQLIHATKPYPEIAAELADLLRSLKIGAEQSPEEPNEITELGETIEDLPPLGAGTRLALELEALPAGKNATAAVQFEKLCESALRLLFEKDLLNWRSQSDIEEGFQRVDVIARLQPTQSAFWSTLAADFRSRYVVFEFKNYANPITQDQVYTTEKYLFTSALRSIAIVIARNGAAPSADRAVRGALREQGKLILCLSMKEFCDLLRGFDNGDTPEALLIQKVDDLLMALAR